MTESPAIQLSDVEAAERLAQVAYTPAERALMLDTVDAQLRHAVARRQVTLPETLGPREPFRSAPTGLHDARSRTSGSAAGGDGDAARPR